MRVDLGSIIPFIFVDNIPKNVNVNAPLCRIAPSTTSGYLLGDIVNNGKTHGSVGNTFPDLKDKDVYTVIYCMYYGADNTRITFL